MRARYTRCCCPIVWLVTFAFMKDDRCIVFFDGVCNLCNGAVNWLVARNVRGKLNFASMQGSTAASLLPVEMRENSQSVIYYRNGRLLVKSTAAVYILSDGAWYGGIAMLLLLVPVFVRDGIYDWVARNRYRWFGKKETCRIPTEAECSYFLN